jgi:signal transduction histidine kinase
MLGVGVVSNRVLRQARSEALARADQLAKLSVHFDQQLEDVSAKLDASHQALSEALAAAEEMALHAMRLQEVTAALSQAQTEDEVADIVLGSGLRVVESVRGVLAGVDGERFAMMRASGYPPEIEAHLLRMMTDEGGPLTRALKRDRPLWLESPEEHLARYPSFYEQLGIVPPQASVAVPLRHGGEIVGALAMFFADTSAFGAGKQAFTLLLAQAAAGALSRARRHAAERTARRGAETLAQARADVLGIVAHDLRNPLNVIASGSALLLEGELPPAQRRKMLEVMQRAGRRMNRLIGDLLDATCLQAGRLSLDLSDVDACKIVREAEETLGPAAAERRIDFHSQAPDGECGVRADEGRLLQVIGNLVANALKFTPAGGRVTLSAWPTGSEVVFNVSDTGPGIPEEHQVHLFDSFWQARTGDRRGVGLGLSITRNIVDALGGRIWVKSTVGVGSTFSFALPSTTRGGGVSCDDDASRLRHQVVRPPRAAPDGADSKMRTTSS